MYQRNKILSLILSILLLVFVVGLAVPEVCMSAGSSGNEDAIKVVFSNLESAWCNKNTEGVIACYHEKAQIRTGAQRKIVTKEQYATIIPKRIKIFGKLKFDPPKIKVKGDEAIVKIAAKYGRGLARKVKFTYKMIYENGKWLIIDQNY